MRSDSKYKKLYRLAVFIGFLNIFLAINLPSVCTKDEKASLTDKISIYELSNGSLLRFKLPKGWEIHKNMSRSEAIIFSPEGNPVDTSIIVQISSDDVPCDLLRLKMTAERNFNILQSEYIKLESSLAYSNISLTVDEMTNEKIKVKIISICKNKKLIQISFSATEKLFEKLLPAFDENLKTFSITLN